MSESNPIYRLINRLMGWPDGPQDPRTSGSSSAPPGKTRPQGSNGGLPIEDRPSDPPVAREKYQELRAAYAAGDASQIAMALMVSGVAYSTWMTPADLDRAEVCFREAFDWCGEDERMRGASRRRLAGVIASRFQEALQRGEEGDPAAEMCSQAATYYYEALQHFPLDKPGDHAETLHQLGDLYNSAGLYEEAVQSYHEATTFDGDNLFDVSRRQLDMVFPVASLGRLEEAKALAFKALEGFEATRDSVGEEAETMAERARSVIATMGG